MRTELSLIEKIEAYLSGSLQGAELVGFEEGLRVDATLRNQVESQSDVVDAVQLNGLRISTRKAWEIYRRKIWITRVILLVVIAGLGIAAYSLVDQAGNSQNNFPPMFPNTTELNAEQETGEESVIDTCAAGEIDHDGEGEITVVSQQSERIEVVEFEEDQLNSSGAQNGYPITFSLDPPDSVRTTNTEEPQFEWIITTKTTKEELHRIGEEIKQAQGSFDVKDVRFAGKFLRRIEFKVMNSAGSVSYSGGPEDADQICIRFGKSSISAGSCDCETDLNEEFFDQELNNLTQQISDSSGLLLDELQFNFDGKFSYFDNQIERGSQKFYDSKKKFFNGNKKFEKFKNEKKFNRKDRRKKFFEP